MDTVRSHPARGRRGARYRRSLVNGRWPICGGTYSPGGAQRRHRQYAGLGDPQQALHLARKLVKAKVENRLGFLMRNSRGKDPEGNAVELIKAIRAELVTKRKSSPWCMTATWAVSLRQEPEALPLRPRGA
ncbi:MAG: CRISPR-associated endonuclease Cas1 [Gammaproteobacteria bacterium]